MTTARNLQELKSTLHSISEGTPLYLHKWFYFNEITSFAAEPNDQCKIFRMFGDLYQNPPKDRIRITNDNPQRLANTAADQKILSFGYEYDTSHDMLLPRVHSHFGETNKGVVIPNIRNTIDVVAGMDQIGDFFARLNLTEFLPTLSRYRDYMNRAAPL